MINRLWWRNEKDHSKSPAVKARLRELKQKQLVADLEQEIRDGAMLNDTRRMR